jgi:hypothetical protein
MSDVDNNFYKILKNNPSPGIFESIFSTLFATNVQTRGNVEKSTSSCRIWQLFYMLLREYNRLTNNQLSIDITSLMSSGDFYRKYTIISQNIHAIIYTYSLSPLYQILMQNNNIEGQIIPVNNISDLVDSNNFCLCIYKPSKLEPGSIDHFFTIFICDGLYYLNSAYGSGLICVPQYTTVLNVSEFNELCEKLNDLSNEANFTVYANFFSKYFGRGAVRIKYDRDIIDVFPPRRFKWKYPEEQVRDEINTVKVNNTPRKIGWIYGYESWIRDYISTEQQMGGKKNKSKKNKSRKNKSRKNKRSKKKRRYVKK